MCSGRLSSLILITLLGSGLGQSRSLQADDRPRLAVLTDIGGDPDDQQSLLRLLLYSNEFRIEAFIASAAGTRGELNESITRPELIEQAVDGFARVLPQLKQHAEGWPNPEELRLCIKSGNPYREREHIGQQHDTEGSSWLISRIDSGSSNDPLNITIWGGQTDLAQCLWQVKHSRSAEQFAAFVEKFRVYDINDQDGIADWMRQEFPGMHYILAKAPPGQDKRLGTYRGMYLTGDLSTTGPAWFDEHLGENHPLHPLYPRKTWTAPNPHSLMKEGDTPSWFFFLKRGGNDPADPSRPGWGGQFQQADDGWYIDLPATADFDPRSTVSRWREDFQHDFALRLQWCVKP